MPTLLESTLWEKILSSIKTKLPGESFETWFHPIRFEGADNGRRVIRLQAPNAAVREWVKTHYTEMINQTLGEANLGGYSIDWIVPENFASATNTVSSGNGAATAVARALEPAPPIATEAKAAEAVPG
jgi:chromosomal replication initiation ATPase DnaA